MIKKEIKKGVNLFLIKDSKFKAFRVCVLMHRPLIKEEVSLNNMLVAVMQRQCKNYPDSMAVSKALENLYGAGLIARASKYGERQIVKLGIKTVSDSATGISGNEASL